MRRRRQRLLRACTCGALALPLLQFGSCVELAIEVLIDSAFTSGTSVLVDELEERLDFEDGVISLPGISNP